MRASNLELDTIDYSMGGQALEVEVARRTLGRIFLKGNGIEVGAGDRPWRIPPGASCFYGDVLDEEGLERYFKQKVSAYQGYIDAQDYGGIADGTFDFSLSAHVLEHLVNPLGSLQAAIRVVVEGGIIMFAVPDKRYTFDQPRPVTSLDHLISDFRSGGEDTRIDGCREHVQYLHPQWAPAIPEEGVEAEARRLAEAKFDTHYHTWTTESFLRMLEWVEDALPVTVLHTELVWNENIAVLRKR